MTSKARKIIAAALKKAAQSQTKSQVEQQAKRSADRETLLSAEAKAHLEEMRSHGFCPPGAMPTVKQYSRYAAFRNAQAASSRAQVIADDAALIAPRGGVVELIYERLADPKLKDTAFAQLTAQLQRSLALAPQLVDETQRVSLATDSNIIADDELAKVAGEFGRRCERGHQSHHSRISRQGTKSCPCDLRCWL